jgi:hypothetical protein
MHSANTVSAPSTQAAAMLCPFHDGAATLDGLLAELDPSDTELFDLALDLRSLAANGVDANACVEQLFRVRKALHDRHYLAFYRVRCWARRALRVEVRAHRAAPWIECPLPLDSARLGEVVNSSLAVLADDGVIPAAAHVRFAFAVSR